MPDKTTGHLEEALKEVHSEKKLIEYISSEDNINPYDSFGSYFKSLEKVYTKEPVDIYTPANIERSYYYHILSGAKRPGRDKILALCLSAGLDLKETKRALEAGGEAPLYSRRRRDSIILYAVNNGCSLPETNELLEKANEPLIG